MKKLSSTRSGEVQKANEPVEVPREFLAFMAIMSREMVSSDTITLALFNLRDMLARAYDEDFAQEYVEKLAQAYAGYRSSWMQNFMG